MSVQQIIAEAAHLAQENSDPKFPHKDHEFLDLSHAAQHSVLAALKGVEAEVEAPTKPTAQQGHAARALASKASKTTLTP